MPVPPLPSNLINTRNIFDICIKLRQEVDELDPRRPIVKCCYKIGMAINNAINEPAFDADGRVNLRAVKALVDAEVRLKAAAFITRSRLTSTLKVRIPQIGCHGMPSQVFRLRTGIPGNSSCHPHYARSTG